MEAYKEDSCQFFPVKGDEDGYSSLEKELGRKMHKAISIMQFKLEGQLLMRNPEYQMDDRCLLHGIDYDKGEITMQTGRCILFAITYFPRSIQKNHMLSQ